jgi:hypothetical protein
MISAVGGVRDAEQHFGFERSEEPRRQPAFEGLTRRSMPEVFATPHAMLHIAGSDVQRRAAEQVGKHRSKW